MRDLRHAQRASALLPRLQRAGRHKASVRLSSCSHACAPGHNYIATHTYSTHGRGHAHTCMHTHTHAHTHTHTHAYVTKHAPSQRTAHTTLSKQTTHTHTYTHIHTHTYTHTHTHIGTNKGLTIEGPQQKLTGVAERMHETALAYWFVLVCIRLCAIISVQACAYVGVYVPEAHAGSCKLRNLSAHPTNVLPRIFSHASSVHLAAPTHGCCVCAWVFACARARVHLHVLLQKLNMTCSLTAMRTGALIVHHATACCAHPLQSCIHNC